jgi:hypothetical protein
MSKATSCQRHRSSTHGGTSVPVHYTAKSRGPKRTHAPATLQELRLVGNKLTAKEEEAHHKEGTHKSRSPRHHNSPRRRSRSRWSRSPSRKYYKIPRHGGTQRYQSPNKASDYEDDEKEMGAPCFIRRVRTTRVPKGLKLPHDQHKYDGSQEPQSWLSDYLQAVRILRAQMR